MPKPAHRAAIVMPCSGSKSQHTPPLLAAGALLMGSQAWLEHAWIARLRKHHTYPLQAAEDRYTGRGFGFGIDAKHAAGPGSEIFVISAGLGFVRGETRIPSYGLTVSTDAGDQENLMRRVTGPFRPGEWWEAMCKGPYSEEPIAALEATQGAILVALTARYAQMAGPTLARLSTAARARLRIFGRGLDRHLPEELHGNLMAYDDRLNAWRPGVMLDFPQRAMWHFAQGALRQAPDGDLAHHHFLVPLTLEPEAFVHG